MSFATDSVERFAPGQASAVARGFDLKRLPDDFFADPFSYYGALREHDPVHRMPDGAYFITRWRDCDAVYRDARVFSSDKKIEFRPKYGDAPLYEHHTTSLVFNDPPLHTHVRRAIQMALSNRVIAEMEAGLVALVDRLIAAMAAKGQADIIEDFASAIPVEIIGNLLGVPHADRAPLRGWSLAILGALEPVLTAEQMACGNDAVRDFAAYLKGLVDDRRRNPGDPEKDLLTRLIRGEHEGRKLSEPELLQNCIFILNAGHETTTNLIGNTLFCLLSHPDALRATVEDPALLPGAIEEVLRVEPPIQRVRRVATEACELGGVAIEAGQPVIAVLVAANRDPARFADPDRFDILRDLGGSAQRHTSFGHGVHFCLGAPLARLEAPIAVQAVLNRHPRAVLPDGFVPAWQPTINMHGLRSLPITSHVATAGSA